MQNYNKRERILDAMQELMHTAQAQAITVSDIAVKAGIGKGSIYYYFSSKNDIIDGVIERSYSRVLDKGRELAAASGLNAFQKMEIIYMPAWTPPQNSAARRKALPSTASRRLPLSTRNSAGLS